MINIIREDNIINLQTTNKCHNLNQINTLLRRKIINSPFKEKYQTTSYVISTLDETNTYSYSICLVDEKGNGIELTEENNVQLENVKVGTAKSCTPPPGCY